MGRLSVFRDRLNIFIPPPTVDYQPQHHPSLKDHGDYYLAEESFEENKPPPPPKKKKPFISYLREAVVIAAILSTMALFSVVIPFAFNHFYVRHQSNEAVGVCTVVERFIFPCFPGITQVTRDQCYQWDCCWRQTEDELGFLTSQCYHRVPSSYRLKLTDPGNLSSSHLNFPLTLQPFYPLPTNLSFAPHYEKSIVKVTTDISDPHRLRLRFFVDEEDNATIASNEKTSSDALYEVRATVERVRNGCVRISVIRRRTNSSVLSMNCIGGLVVTDSYTEGSILLPPNVTMYGFGFSGHSRLVRTPSDSHWTLLSDPGRSFHWGSHPQYLAVEPNGVSHGILINSGQVMEVRLLDTPALVFRTTGKSLDLYIALGPTPDDVVSQLSDIENVRKRPPLPPYWALGYHLCPMGNVSASNVTETLIRANIPFESYCVDADAWQKTVFETATLGLSFRQAVSALQKQGRKVLAVSFPQVAQHKQKSNVRTFAYDRGKQLDVFLSHGNGKFWDNVSVVFPDPTNPETVGWLREVIRNVAAKIETQFDGFVINYDSPLDLRNETAHPCHSPKLPFVPHMRKGNLSDETLCLDVTYHSNRTHLQLINKYGRLYAEALTKALTTADRPRSFVLNLFTHIGSSGSWGGPFPNTWPALRQSLVHVQESSIYGIPLYGVPICGHLGPSSDQELCSRWFQLGAFYPLAMSFYDSYESERHPMSFNTAVASVARQAISLRYALFPYLYTLFHQASVHGTPVLRPLFFEFPQYPQARNTTDLFMWGKSILFVHCLERGKQSIRVWLPPSCWYDYYSAKKIEVSEDDVNGTWLAMAAPRHYFNVYVRGGRVVVTQRTGMTLSETRKSDYVLYVALDCAGREGLATGVLVLDDGLTQNGPVLRVRFEAVNRTLNLRLESVADDVLPHLRDNGISSRISQVRIYGVKEVWNVTVDGRPLSQNQTLGYVHKTMQDKLIIYYLMELDSNHTIVW